MVTRSDVNPASHNRMQTFRQSGGLVGVVACAIGFLLATTLAGCHGDLGDRLQSGQVLDWHGLQGRWAGPVVPTDPTCGSTTQGLMTIGVKNFGFDPFQGTTVIQGEVDKDRILKGTFARQGGEHQNLSITFEGSSSDSATINGTLQSGRCHWMVTLHRG
jgi:hypothetical protein